ncbi:hypothetical protein BV96_04673 [Sphingomonas paucimobilis]|nr:hypothetical protein BV96_04673 [Sphingomonas paucimobilis]
MIAEFTLEDGNPVSINMDQVDYFQPCDDGTLVVLADGPSSSFRKATTLRRRS